MSTDPVPDGLTDEQKLTYFIGATAQNAAAVEGAVTRLPKHVDDAEIQAALTIFRGTEEVIRRERNLLVHGSHPGDWQSARGNAQVQRRLLAQIDALGRLIAGDEDRARLLKIARGTFRMDAEGAIHDVEI